MLYVALKPNLCLDLNSSLISLSRVKTVVVGKIGDAILFAPSTPGAFLRAWHSVFSSRQPVIVQEDYREQLGSYFRVAEQNNIEQKILIVGWTPLEDFPNLYSRAL